MKISTATSGIFSMVSSMEEGMKIIADAGFEAIDFSIFTNSWDSDLFMKFSDAEFADHFRRIGRLTKDCGLEMYQCHAPFPLKVFDPAQDEAMLKSAIRSIYASAYMDCPNIVIHPGAHSDSIRNGTSEGMCGNLEFYGAMADALRDTGVTVCIENLWYPDSEPGKYLNVTTAVQLSELIDTLNDRHGNYYGVCFDTGHALMTGDNCASMVKTLGQRVKVLHVHDNTGTSDMHQALGRGNINWREFSEALGEIGYQGTFNFEADWFCADYRHSDTYSKDVLRSACNMLCTIGRSLASIADGTFKW